jgi:phenylalanyl-tRNA synthetase beta subunit
VTKIEALENQVSKLSPEELRAFRRWFVQFDAAQWDDQIEEDARAGKLDRLADEALAAHRRGEGRDI